jgi:hypothetical protein
MDRCSGAKCVLMLVAVLLRTFSILAPYELTGYQHYVVHEVTQSSTGVIC